MCSEFGYFHYARSKMIKATVLTQKDETKTAYCFDTVLLLQKDKYEY